MINVAIIEDEQPAIDRILTMLSSHCPEINVACIVKTGREAINECEVSKPELIFLDIHLPDMKGFEVIKSLSYEPYVIFTTAYKEYAIEAFQTWAIDYLLKPFDEGQLLGAIQKYNSITAQPIKSSPVDWDRLAELFYAAKKRTSLSVKEGDKIKLIDQNKIAYILAEDKYCKIYLTSGENMFCDYLLKDVESRLNDSFIRIHRSTIVNASHVTEISKGFKSRYTFHFGVHALGSVRSGGSYMEEIVRHFRL